jgi:hypothetical protein
MSDEDGASEPGEAIETIPKPDALLALHDVAAEMFTMLRTWFDVAPEVTLDLREVDSAVAELGDPVLIAALAMRKLQALHLLATPGVRTTTDVVVAIVNDLDRALVQAPVMRLKVQAAVADWDRELIDLESGVTSGADDAPETDDVDWEVERFRSLHALLHEAMFSVIEASEGEIRYLV